MIYFFIFGEGGVATRKCIWRNQAVLARSTLHSKYKKNEEEEGVEKVGSVGLISGLAHGDSWEWIGAAFNNVGVSDPN